MSRRTEGHQPGTAPRERLDRWEAAMRSQAGRGVAPGIRHAPGASRDASPAAPAGLSPDTLAPPLPGAFARLYRWSQVGAPTFPGDDLRTQDAAFLNMVLIGLLLVVAMNSVAAITASTQLARATTLLFALLAVIAFSHRLMRTGRVYLASLLLVAGVWLVFTARDVLSGGTFGLGIAMSYGLVCLVTGMLLGLRAALTAVTASTAVLVGLAVTIELGHPPPVYFKSRPTTIVVAYTSIFLVFVAIKIFTSVRYTIAVDRASEQIYRQAMEQAVDGILISDASGHAVLANSALQDMLGLKEAEFRDVNVIDTSLPDDPAIGADRYRRLAAGERLRFERSMRRKDGTEIHVEVTASRLKDGRIQGIIRDVSERKHAERALREGEERFQRLAAAAFEGIAITDEGRIVDMNPQFAEMLGYPVAELIGRQVLELVAPEHHGLVLGHIRSGSPDRYEHLALRKDGRRVNVEVQGRTIPFEGRSMRVTAVRDTTDRIQLEENFRQAQKMEAVGRLAGGVAHDFNNLLTVITSYSEMLLEDFDAADPRWADVDQIRKAAGMASTLTRQLLAFSRQQVLAPKVLLLNRVVTGTEKILKRVLGDHITLVVAQAPDVGRVRADASQIEQVIMNLAVNSHDAMPDGGTLTITTTNADLSDDAVREHAYAKPGRYVLLAIRDTGIGMDAPTKSRIFEPFFTTKETGKGTGLGLATVYGIVKQSGGFIWVYSEPAQGTEFKIYLPRVDESVPAEAAEPVAVPGGGTETVLLVEDAPGVRAAAHRVLTRHGYTVLEANDGQAALAAAADHPGTIHLLLTDVVMPGMNGRHLAEQLSALRPELKVVYMSGYTDDAVIRHGVGSQGAAFLQKPFTPDGLARKVRATLDASRES